MSIIFQLTYISELQLQGGENLLKISRNCDARQNFFTKKFALKLFFNGSTFHDSSMGTKMK